MPCLLMSVKITKNKDSISAQPEAKIIGSIDKFYTFSKIADFQYLPMCSNVVSKSATLNKQSSNNEGLKINNLFKKDLNISIIS